LRFASLGSGSRGNAVVVEHGATCLLVDCGFSVRETERRLRRLGLEPERLSALLVTHEHADHVGGVGVLARRYGMPVWMTPGTRAAAQVGELPRFEPLDCHHPFALDDIEIHPFPVPHDAREPCQFVFSDGARRLGVLTDTGESTPHVAAQLVGCDALLLEANHDRQMLHDGPYPPSLKARVGGRLGHLSNDQAAALLGQVDCTRLQHVVAGHLSDKNNRPELARRALGEALGCEPEWVAVADQVRGIGWRDVR